MFDDLLHMTLSLDVMVTEVGHPGFSFMAAYSLAIQDIIYVKTCSLVDQKKI